MLFFDTIIVRTPIKSQPENIDGLNDVSQLTEDVLNDPLFSTAIMVSNPPVYQLLMDYKLGKIRDEKKIRRLRSALLDYLNRMTLNPTPLGLFASIGILKWAKDAPRNIVRHHLQCDIDIDSEVLDNLISRVNSENSVKNNIKYYLNSTIYTVRSGIRYVEEYLENAKIRYRVSSVENAQLLTALFPLLKSGIRKKEFCKFFTDKSYPQDDVENYFESLLSSKILLPELRFNISGTPPLDAMLNVLQKYIGRSPEFDLIVERVKEIKKALSEIHNYTDDDFFGKYKSLEGIIQGLNIAIPPTGILKVNTFSGFSNSEFPVHYQKDLESAAQIIGYFNEAPYITSLENFKIKFRQRYEDDFIPLLNVLDPDLGIGFANFTSVEENLLLPTQLLQKLNAKKEKSLLFKKPAYEALITKITRALLNNEKIVHISENDFEDPEVNRVKELAVTGQIIFTIEDAENDLIFIDTLGNASAGNLISRFASSNTEIYALLKEIAAAESDYYSNCIVAEVVTLSDRRMGNITFKPHIRDYEIPLFAFSELPGENQISLDDLYVSLVNNKIVLYSKSKNARVIPYVTNAHNYNKDTTPLLQFLGEVQYQYIIPSFRMDVDELVTHFDYIPEVRHKSVVLIKESWIITEEEIKQILGKIDDIEYLKAFVKKRNLPEFTFCNKFGNNSITRWCDKISVGRLLKQARSEKYLILNKCNIDAENYVQDPNGQSYLAEYITFYKNDDRPPFHFELPYNIKSKFESSLKTTFIPGDEWLYVKIYAGVNTLGKVLKIIHNALICPLFNSSLVEKFFFIRYFDTEHHIRLRFLVRKEDVGNVISQINDFLNKHFKELIAKTQIDTYQREIQRYGFKSMDMAEDLFQIDSFFVLSLLAQAKGDLSYCLPLIGIAGINAILDGFMFDDNKKLQLLTELKISYEKEFKIEKDPALDTLIKKMELDNRKEAERILDGDYSLLDKVMPAAALRTGLEELKQKIRLYCDALDPGYHFDDFVKSNINSFLHMHAIRVFPLNPRENELMIYTVLYSYYKKKHFLNKNREVEKTVNL